MVTMDGIEPDNVATVKGLEAERRRTWIQAITSGCATLTITRINLLTGEVQKISNGQYRAMMKNITPYSVR